MSATSPRTRARSRPRSRTSRGARWPSTSTTASARTTSSRATRPAASGSCAPRSRTRPRSCWPPTPTARASRSAGTCARCSSRRCRSAASSSTRSPRRRSAPPSRTRATSTSSWSTPRRAAASSIGCTATWSRRCCGRRCRPGSAPDACRAWPCGSSSSARRSAAPSAAAPTGTSRLACEARESPSQRGSSASVTRGWPAAATSTPLGRLKSEEVRRLSEASARRLAEALPESLPWRVTAVDERPGTQRPSPPFTTSTLQQEANRKLGFSADRTMSAAQRLFTEGLISYHRTDSTTLSERALGEAAGAIRDLYGEQFYGGPRQYRTTVKNAQEAHEAIRPTNFGQTAGRGPAPRPRRAAPLRPRLEARRGLADGRCPRAAHEPRDHRRRVRMGRPSSPRRARRSSSPASCAPTSRAPTIRPPSSATRRRCCRS